MWEVSEKMMNEIGNKSTEALKKGNFINIDKYQALHDDIKKLNCHVKKQSLIQQHSSFYLKALNVESQFYGTPDRGSNKYSLTFTMQRRRSVITY